MPLALIALKFIQTLDSYRGTKIRTDRQTKCQTLLKLGSTPSHVRRTPGELAVEYSYVHHVTYTRRLSSAAYDVLLFASNGTLGGLLIFPKWLKNDNIWINFIDNKSAMNMYLVFVYFAVNLLLGYEADGESEFYPELAIMKGRGKPVKKREESASVSGPGDKDLAEQYRTLEREYEADEERLHRLERDVRVLHDQTAKQVEFSYKMSSVLGDYLKEATKDSGTISAMVNDPGLKQFLEMMYRVFFNLNERGMTKNSEEDGRFIQSLVFIILNISQHPQGQEFILSEKFTEVLAILLRLLDSDPDKDVKGHGHECTFGEHLQVILMRIFVNLSKSAEGLQKVLKMPEIPISISRAIKAESWNPIRTPALELLTSLTSNLESEKEVAEIIRQVLPIKNLEDLTMAADADVKRAATAALDNVRVAADHVRVALR
uniref:Uncharacterized protein n=1 Tax=Timema tahoe TaxID=61484 RepID=A0A7R9IDC7_9NEOP|nr:unnamed protein product [Timema tahoe]